MAQGKNDTQISYPFKGVTIDSVVIEYKNSSEISSLDKKSLNDFQNFLTGLRSDSLVKGKRLHGAKTIFNIRL